MKILIVVLLIFSICGSAQNEWDYSQYRSLVILTEKQYDDHKIQAKIRREANKWGFSVKTEPLPDNMDTIEYINKYKFYEHIINLRAKKFNTVERCNSYLLSGLVCLSDVHLCQEGKMESNDMIYNYMEKDEEVILVSASLLKYNEIIDIILKNENKNALADKTVICLPEDINTSDIEEEVNKWAKDISIEFRENCEGKNFDGTVSGVVAKMPLQADSKVPTVFYHTPYFLPEYKDWYPNSINLMTSWQPLIYGLIKFLNEMTWSRIGVVTDDSEYSDAVLKELIPLFIKSKIVYDVQECSGIDCNFNRALRQLDAAKAKIIFLNVGVKHGKKLMQTMSKLQMTNVIWIVRDWPFKEILVCVGRNAIQIRDEVANYEKQDASATKLNYFLDNNICGISNRENRNNIFSITFSPVFHKKILHVPYASSILKALYILRDCWKEAKYIDEYISNFMETPAIQKSHSKSYVYVIRDKSVVCEMNVNENTATVEHITKIFDQIPSDLYEQCLVRSNNFHNPCNDVEILLFLIVVIMFTLMTFLIFVYFNNVRPNYHQF